MLSFRKVKKDDWSFILELRNQFYKNFEKQKLPIPLAEHIKYMEHQLTNLNFKQWIIIDNEIDIGYIRILDMDISILIKKEFHSQGFGTNSLKFLLKQENLPEKLIGRVLAKNTSSVKAFEKAGFKLKMLVFEKVLKD